MKKTFTFLLLQMGIVAVALLSLSAQSYAQETIFCVSEQPPKPTGGMVAFFEFTDENIRRPNEAKLKGVKGNVFVQFIVEKDGKLSNIKIVKGIGAGCDEAVVKCLEKCPKWIPGIQQGKPVRVQKTLAINVR